MKKSLFDIVATVLPDSENIHISDNAYTDTYFNTGFTCPGVFIGFDFFCDADRANYERVIRALNRKRNLSIDIIKHTGSVAGLSVRYTSDYSMFAWIESERAAAHNRYWLKDHDLRVSGVSDVERAAIMDALHRENVRTFLAKYGKVSRIA